MMTELFLYRTSLVICIVTYRLAEGQLKVNEMSCMWHWIMS